MLKLIQACAPWLTWKAGAVYAAIALVVGITFSAQAGSLAFLGATPILAIAACMLPCLIPLAFLRAKENVQPNTTPSTAECRCGSDACTIGADANSCQAQSTQVTERRA